ncbi:uncharacterized protein LOC132601804 [Lycium barbarum]|uniref:uncharacterized protein LOC132601804 n=1 Tax=Lycium barbarum TaxID=112863 RepID=UPI00293E654D|nr:uncharacterized protein LOC132601804 [Lycium barbarum]
MCECFNAMIIEARDKPIITLLEKIRYLLMARMQANRDKSAKWDINDVCPRIKDILKKNQKTAAEFIPRKSNEWNYEIIGANINNKRVVDLLNKICNCRKWDLTGIPCKHAIAAIWAKKDEINSYVHDCYKVETYRRVYDFAILPMNGQDMWPKSNNIALLPPKLVRTSTKGRKQTKRRKEPDEVGASRTKMKRRQTSLDCSKCHNTGHNRRACKLYVVQPDLQVNEPSSYASGSSTRAKLPVSINYS